MDSHASVIIHLLLSGLEKFDGFNFDCLVKSRRQYQNFPSRNFELYGIQQLVDHSIPKTEDFL